MADDRIVSLDVVRGVAVMGILVANLPGFALPGAAYFSPLAWGGTAPADVAAWFATLVLVEGKMRGLFSFLFGASVLLVLDRARAAGEGEAQVHLARMAALFAIGCAHLYLVWGSDILTHYALVGGFAFTLRHLPPRWLIATGLVLVGIQLAQGIANACAVWPGATAETAAAWRALSAGYGVPPAAEIADELRAFRGGWAGEVAWRWEHLAGPLGQLLFAGVETLSAMLLGMAAYRTGFLTNAWPRGRYRRWATTTLALALPAYVALGIATVAHGFDPRWVFLGSTGVSAPIRTLGFVGYAAFLLLLVRPGGAVTNRVAAVGRAAFTNYLATSVAMTFVFYGWGLGRFGHWSRAELYWLAPVAWVAMLAWSQPWLARYRYGPAEWLWRSLARLEPQPMRR